MPAVYRLNSGDSGRSRTHWGWAEWDADNQVMLSLQAWVAVPQVGKFNLKGRVGLE